jgi:hypothetical protein
VIKNNKNFIETRFLSTPTQLMQAVLSYTAKRNVSEFKNIVRKTKRKTDKRDFGFIRLKSNANPCLTRKEG